MIQNFEITVVKLNSTIFIENDFETIAVIVIKLPCSVISEDKAFFAVGEDYGCVIGVGEIDDVGPQCKYRVTGRDSIIKWQSVAAIGGIIAIHRR